MSSDSDILSVPEAAELLSVHQETVRRLARQGELPSFKVGRHWRFRRSELLRWTDDGGGKRASRAPSVLIIDDQDSVLRTVSRLVESNGYHVRVARDGAEGLIEVARQVPDLVLLDLEMPVVNGPEFLRRVRPAHPELPVIVVSGYPNGDLMLEAAQHGLVMLLSKPVDPARLQQALHMVLPLPAQEKVV